MTWILWFKWGFGGFVYNIEVDAFLDINKARRFGFHEMNGDSLKIFLNTFKQLKDKTLSVNF